MDELDFVDPDVRALFDREGMAWVLGTPSTVQLAKDMRGIGGLLRELVDELQIQRVVTIEAIDKVRSSVDDLYNLLWDMNEHRR